MSRPTPSYVCQPPWYPFRCPRDGRYVGGVRATFGYLDPDAYDGRPGIKTITGVCKTHGQVDITDPAAWDADLFEDVEL